MQRNNVYLSREVILPLYKLLELLLLAPLKPLRSKHDLLVTDKVIHALFSYSSIKRVSLSTSFQTYNISFFESKI